MTSKWLKSAIEARSDLVGTSMIGDGYFSQAIECLNSLMSQIDKTYQIFVVASKSQNSSIMEIDDEKVITLDVTQSLVLKELVRRMHTTPGPLYVVDLLQVCCAIDISEGDENHSLLLLEPTLDDSSPIWHVDLPERLNTMNLLSDYEPVISQGFPYETVDIFIALHEFHHLLHNEQQDMTEWARQISKESFEYAKHKILGHKRDDFKSWVIDLVDMSDDGLEEIKKDLEAREESYALRANEIIEELASDVFAIGLLAQSAVPNTPERLYQLSHIIFLIFSAYDLHQSMIKRARHSIKEGIANFKPAHVADLHLRKIAMVYALARLHYLQVSDKHFDSNVSKEELSEYLSHYEDALYTYNTILINNYVIPVTKGMRQIFEGAESSKNSLRKPLSRSRMDSLAELKSLVSNDFLRGVFGELN